MAVVADFGRVVPNIDNSSVLSASAVSCCHSLPPPSPILDHSRKNFRLSSRVEVKIITGLPRGQIYGIRQAQSSSTNFMAPFSVNAKDAPAKDFAIDLAIISSRHCEPPRLAPLFERSSAIVDRIEDGDRLPINCGTASILKVSVPNSSI